MKKQVLILANSVLNSDPRVLRQISFFQKKGFDITLCGQGYDGELPFFPLAKPKSLFSRGKKLFLMLGRLSKLRVHDFLKHSSFQELSRVEPTFDLILGNDLETWPIAINLKKAQPKAKVIFDAHEQYTKEFSDRFVWNWFHREYMKFVSKEYIPKADKFITVCEGIARDYEQEYGIKPLLVLNSPEYEPGLSPSPMGETIELIHHGIANRSRKIEKMIRLMDYLDAKFTLKLMLVPSDLTYLIELKDLAKGKAVEFLAPVPTKEISKFINQFDIGLFLLEPVNFNYEHALPNKFFEFIQARLGIAIGPSPEMKSIVDKEGNGIVSETFEEKKLAEKLNGLDRPQIQKMKENSDAIARKYSNEQNEVVLDEILNSLGLSASKSVVTTS